ncbi:hypothetical protein MJH12_14210, partial [bacterium]|nr:hypothetical protein [bacterium]
SIGNKNMGPIKSILTFSPSFDLKYFETKLKPIDTKDLKPGIYYLIWKIENIALEFAQEFQAKLKVSATGIHT